MSDSEEEGSFDLNSPRNVNDWGDLEVESDDGSDLPEPFIKEDDSQTPASTSCCYKLTEHPEAENLVSLLQEIPFIQKVECQSNTLREALNSMVENDEDYDDNHKLNILNAYFKVRHDTLAVHALRVLHMVDAKTDTSFFEKFGIPSKKTPDYIFDTKQGCLIVEVAAVSDPERAYRSKGDITKGYTPKYDKEIEQLKALGHTVHYSVLVYNVSQQEDQDHVLELRKIADLMGLEGLDNREEVLSLEIIRREFITQNKVVFELYSHLLNILFGSPYEIFNGPDREELDIYGEPIAKYEGSYERVAVSSNLFDRVNAMMPRFPSMLERVSQAEPENTKYQLVFEGMSSLFKFEKATRTGHTYRDWMVNLNNDSKAWVCNNLKLVSRGEEFKKPKAEFEFFSYSKAKNIRQPAFVQQWFNSSHATSIYTKKTLLHDYTRRLATREIFTKSCKYEDANLEARLISGIVEQDKASPDLKHYLERVSSLKHKPLCSRIVNNEMFSNAKLKFDEAMTEDKSNGSPLIYWVKPPFIYPIAQISGDDYTDHKVKPKILDALANLELGPYTDKAIRMASAASFSFGTRAEDLNKEYEAARIDLAKYQREVTSMLKAEAKSTGAKRLPKVDSLRDAPQIKSHLKSLYQKMETSAKEHGVTNKNIGLIKMGRGGNLMNNDFQKEMSHFKAKQTKSHYKGVGNNYNPTLIDSLFAMLKQALFSPSDSVCPDTLYDDYTARDNFLMMQLKQVTLDKSRDYYNALRSTHLYHSCAFISRLCHTLMFHSQTSINSSYVVPDNLGYDNVLILIRGGKKIFSTKKSKLFRMVIPTFTACSRLYTDNNEYSNFSYFSHSGRTYLVTPWANMHETVLGDGLTMLHRLMGFAMMNHIPEMNLFENLDRVYFNIILAFHNRRQTESMLHNIRYIFMNCMSEIAAVDEILPEMAGFNYDYFQAWVRHKLSTNFQAFATVMKKIHDSSKNGKIGDFGSFDLLHPFNGHRIKDITTLALGIYSSYLMSKAPTTQTLEQVGNLKSMMSVHEEFMQSVGEVGNNYVKMETDFVEYSEELQSNDFNFDPSYCHLLGKFMGDYILNLERKSKLIQKWDSVLDVNWDNMANTKGLRGTGEDFFGNKGYYVVYDDVRQDTEALEKTLELIEGVGEVGDVEKELKSLNTTYRGRIGKKSLDGVVFHVVDKVQRGGGREIFVMDKETKVHQQVIEDYTKYICKLIPNEMISIPSNRRLSSIHSKVFEDLREQDEKYYWVLDCRKWAPKSIIEKFIIFLMGAKHALPETFVAHAINFFTMLRKKRIYTRPHVVEILGKSVASAKYKKYFIMDETRKAYYFEMRYSWVMGIFNYFSSLVHVANQLHASHMIRLTAQISYSTDSILHMVAHSDDSAGKLLAKDKLQLVRASFIYETLMHAANHLLSKKKCNQGKMYYEFISILYIGGTLLSLLAKFTGMFNFHPTDKGYCSDITDAYSKSTELVLNGATFSQSYLAMKIQSNLIYRFYFGNTCKNEYYNLPPSMFGVPDAHPLMVLVCGSDADFFRIMQTGDDHQGRMIFIINKLMLPPGAGQDGFLKMFKCSPNVKLGKKLEDLRSKVKVPDKFLDTWTLKNVKFRHSQLNLIQFVDQLSDKSFVAALQDESLTRRLSRAYHFRANFTVETSWGKMKPREVRELLFLLKRSLKGDTEFINPEVAEVIKMANDELEGEEGYREFVKTFEFLFTEIRSLDSYLNKLRYTDSMVVDFKKTNKPVYITLQKTLEENPIDYNPQSLCSWIKEPEYRHLLPDTRGYNTAVGFLRKVLEDKDVSLESIPTEHLFTIIQKMKMRSRVEYFCYSNLPSQMREVSTYQDVLNFIAHNTFAGKYIQGLAIQFGKTINMPMENITTDLDSDDLQYSLSLVVLANAVMSSKDYRPEMMELHFIRPEFLTGPKEVKFRDLIGLVIDFWKSQHRVYPYVKCMFNCCEQLIMGKTQFEGSVLNDTYYHCYVKRQTLVDNIWLGQGRLFISLGKVKLVFIIINTRVERVVAQITDYMFESTEVAYMNLCLKEGALPFLQENMAHTSVEDWECDCLGLDKGGNYYLGRARDSLKHLKISFDSSLSTPLSAIAHGTVRSFKGSRLIWETYFDGKRHSFYINTLPVEVQNSVALLRGSLLDNTHNKEILKESTSSRNIMIEVCAKELDLERAVDFEVVVKNYHMSDLYKVLKTCQMLKLSKVNKPEMKISNFPAPDGGLLNALMAYAQYDNTFDFKWDRSLSPEYLALKSTQPEAFLTEFVETMRAKFDELYTSNDKAAIHKALSNLGADINTNESEEKLMNLLCTWGYAGVAGAINELNEIEDRVQFEKIRSYRISAPYIGLFADSLMELLSAIFDTYKNHSADLDFLPISIFDGTQNLSDHDLNMQRMSTIHSINLDTYYKNVVDKWVVNDNLYVVHLMLKSILSCEGARQDFKKWTKTKLLFRNLPVNQSVCLDWQASLMSLYDCYVLCKAKGCQLDYNVRRSLDTELVNPYVTTRDTLAKSGIQISATRLFHFGAISNYLFDLLKQNFKDNYRNKELYFKIKIMTPTEVEKVRTVPFNKDYFFKHKLSEDFLDDEDTYGEIMYELQSNSPDLDTIQDILQESGEYYDKSERSKVKVSIRGRLTDMLKFELCIYLAFGGSLTIQMYDKLRMMGEDVIVVTNKLPIKLLMCKFCMCFQSRDRAWRDMTMLDPSKIYYLVFSRDLSDPSFWSKVLNADQVTQEIRGRILREGYLTYRGESGELANVDAENQEDNLWDDFQKHLKHVEEEEAKKLNEGESSAKPWAESIDEVGEKLSSEGLDEEQIAKYREVGDKAKTEGGGWKAVFDALNSMSESKGVEEFNKGGLADKMAEIIRKPKTAREHEMIMQTPRIFGGGRRRGKAVKNSLFRERKIIAEIDSFCPGVIWNILAGTLYISKNTYELVKNQVNIYKMLMNGVKRHKPGKQFMLNLCMLILNDANIVDDADGDHETWRALIGATQKHMLMDEGIEEDEEDWGFYDEEPEQGDLRYRIAGSFD